MLGRHCAMLGPLCTRDQVRRGLVNQLRAVGHTDEANSGLYRAYLLKEQLREIFACRDLGTAKVLLAGWISWAQRCRLPAFMKLATTITHYRTLILRAAEHSLSNARSEATLTRRAYGYHSPESLIALADLTRVGRRPPLPGRS